MSEMKQLEENTKVQKAKETAEELEAYIQSINRSIEVRSEKYFKHQFYEIGAVFLWIGSNFTGNEWIFIAGWFLWIIMFSRGKALSERLEKKFSEFDGAIETLCILGYIDRDELNKRKRKQKRLRVSPFSRFKEFFERLGKSKEAYGT